MFKWLKGTSDKDVGEPFTLADEHAHRVREGQDRVDLFRSMVDGSHLMGRAERREQHAELDRMQARVDRGEWL